MKLIINSLSSFKNYDGEIGIILYDKDGSSTNHFYTSDGSHRVIMKDALDDVQENHLREELQENSNLLQLASDYNIVTVWDYNFTEYLNYVKSYN
jgi:hypothetical protein